MLGGAIGASVDDDLDAIIITGGTGLSPRDRTVEALLPMFQKRIDGFGEAFRRLSFDAIGPRAILSNAVAGIVRRCVVIALPGSVNAVRLAVDALVAPTLTHAVALARGIPHGHGDAHGTRGEPR
jgi:molybdenum cofactor biosynthesis protein B